MCFKKESFAVCENEKTEAVDKQLHVNNGNPLLKNFQGLGSDPIKPLSGQETISQQCLYEGFKSDFTGQVHQFH